MLIWFLLTNLVGDPYRLKLMTSNLRDFSCSFHRRVLWTRKPSCTRFAPSTLSLSVKFSLTNCSQDLTDSQFDFNWFAEFIPSISLKFSRVVFLLSGVFFSSKPVPIFQRISVWDLLFVIMTDKYLVITVEWIDFPSHCYLVECITALMLLSSLIKCVWL